MGKCQVSLELPRAQGAQSFSCRDLSDTDLEGRQAQSLTDTWPSRAREEERPSFKLSPCETPNPPQIPTPFALTYRAHPKRICLNWSEDACGPLLLQANVREKEERAEG